MWKHGAKKMPEAVLLFVVQNSFFFYEYLEKKSSKLHKQDNQMSSFF